MAVQSNNLDGALWSYSAPPAMDTLQLSRWLDLLAQRTGINWPVKRKSFLLTSLSTRMRELGFSSYDAYFQYLTSGRRGAVEWEILVEYLTVHESRYYRDQLALSFVSDVFLPAYCENFKDKPVNIKVWSIGCATGEEPYSLAMLIDNYITRKNLTAYYSITASDVSAASLSTARKAIYHINRLKELPKDFLKYYFTRHDENHFQVRQHIKDRVCFTRLNIIKLSHTKVGKMDLIFCQNVLIYFNRKERNLIVNEMANHLQPGGILILGSGEVSDWNNKNMEQISFRGALVFRRKVFEECK